MYIFILYLRTFYEFFMNENARTSATYLSLWSGIKLANKDGRTNENIVIIRNSQFPQLTMQNATSDREKETFLLFSTQLRKC